MRKPLAYVSSSSPVLLSLGLLGFLAIGCKDSSTTTTEGGGMCTDPSATGVVKAPADAEKDTHCIDASGKPIKLEVSQASCHLTNLDAATSSHDHGGDEDAGAEAAATDTEEAPPRYGSEADDDDCKYHVSWSASCVQKNQDITFTIKAVNTYDGKPVMGANPYIEAQLTDDHLAPDTSPKTKETSPGTYTIGPIRFNASGRWTVKFHFAANCTDLADDSPHGHVTFYVDVP
jgi:YtkA-like protein